MFPTFFSIFVGVSLVTNISGMLNSSLAPRVLATHGISLEKRQPNEAVNAVFKDNILLNLAYLRGTIQAGKEVNWDEIRKPFTHEFSLMPGETFAYHENVLPAYSGKVSKTTNAHFQSGEGFISDGYLIGDGVCHLASLFYWVAKDAGLGAVSPTNHDFADIPEIPREFGVSIYNQRGNEASSAMQNLYITNSFENTVKFQIKYNGENLTIKVLKTTDSPF